MPLRLNDARILGRVGGGIARIWQEDVLDEFRRLVAEVDQSFGGEGRAETPAVRPGKVGLRQEHGGGGIRHVKRGQPPARRPAIPGVPEAAAKRTANHHVHSVPAVPITLAARPDQEVGFDPKGLQSTTPPSVGGNLGLPGQFQDGQGGQVKDR